MLAYLSRTDIAIRQIEKLSWDWIKMDCSGGKCYGLLAVRVDVRLRASTDQVLGAQVLLCFGFVPLDLVSRLDRRDFDQDEASGYPEWVR